MTFETTPEAFACALIEQIISSRKPLPVSVLEMPTTYFLAVPPVLLEPPQAATSKPAARINPMALGHLPTDIRQPPLNFKPSAGTARWVESDSLGKSCAATKGGNRLPPTREIVKAVSHGVKQAGSQETRAPPELAQTIREEITTDAPPAEPFE